MLAICLMARLSGILTRRNFVVTAQSVARGECVPVRWRGRIPARALLRKAPSGNASGESGTRTFNAVISSRPLPPRAFPEAALVRFCVLAIGLMARLSGILTRRNFVVTAQSAARGECVPVRWRVRIPDLRIALREMLLPGTRRESVSANYSLRRTRFIAPPATGNGPQLLQGVLADFLK